MYRIYVDGYFVGVEILTPKEVSKLNKDNSIRVVSC